MNSVDVTEVVDRAPLSKLQVMVLVLAGITIVLDGLDIQLIAFAAPRIAADLGLERVALGPVFSAGLLGMVAGSVIMGPVADRYGRRLAVLLSVATFGSFTLLTAFASSFADLMLFRFLTGLGLGGALPSLVALISEYSPRRIRALVTGAVLAGVPAGGLLGGLLATWAIPRFGWPSVFLVGGGLPLLLLLPLLWVKLPESLRFMVARGNSDIDRAKAVLAQIDPSSNFGPNTRFVDAGQSAGAAEKSSALSQLFGKPMLRNTLLLWCTFFTNLMGIYFLFSWIPTLLVDAGYSLAMATTAAVVFNFGGLFGLVGLGWIISRYGVQIKHVIAVALLIGSIHVALVGVLAAQLVLMLLAVFVAGIFILGTQGQLFNLGTNLYPTTVRATGIGAAAGFGRVGSVLGPLLGSVLIWTGLGVQTYFGLFGALLFIGAVATMGVRQSENS